MILQLFRKLNHPLRDALGGGVGVDDGPLTVAYGDHLRDVIQKGASRGPRCLSRHPSLPLLLDGTCPVLDRLPLGIIASRTRGLRAVFTAAGALAPLGP